MGSEAPQKLHWTQRIALVRHNLHSARRTGDYTFFRTLQAHTLLDGTDHVALLHSLLGDEADSVLSTLDNLNAGIAYVHQDAFKAVYDGAKATMYKVDNTPASRRSLLRVDIGQQRDMADMAIDKTTNSAVNLIETQPVFCQEAIANAWITGATIIADAVCVCLKQMEDVEENMDDFIRLEYSWSCIQNSVDAAISALRGIFNLMASPAAPPPVSRNMSISSGMSSDGSTSTSIFRGRNPSTANALGLIKRALSHSQMLTPQAPTKSARSASVSIPDTSSRGFRMSMSAACPTRISNFSDQHSTSLPPIPPTPAIDENTYDTLSFFKKTDDYFTVDTGSKSDAATKERSASEDLMHL